MGKYSDQEWYKTELNKYMEKYGEIPPPWIYEPHSHPYSMEWRMGDGETFMMLFHEWFPEIYKTEEKRIAYFKKYSPPPRWLGWTANAIWDIPSWTHEGFSYVPYFEKLQKYGFEGILEYAKDLNDDKWND